MNDIGRPTLWFMPRTSWLIMIVGKVIVDDRDTNLEMIRSGFAWWYLKYAGEQSAADQKLYENAEKHARADRVGLWSGS